MGGRSPLPQPEREPAAAHGDGAPVVQIRRRDPLTVDESAVLAVEVGAVDAGCNQKWSQ